LSVTEHVGFTGRLGFAPDRLSGDASPWEGTRGRVLLCSSNGGGLGHLTRLMAVARRLPPTVDVVFVTMSQGMPLVTREGYVAEYIPSASSLQADAHTWHRYLRQRMDALVEQYRPDVLVFDGVSLYRGLLESWHAHRHRTRVWLRRTMWRPGASVPAQHADVFDLILEPGDVASGNDATAPTGEPGRVQRVRPIVHLDERELLPREAARDALGLDPERPAVLLSLGAGNINDIGVTVTRIVDRLRAVSDAQVVMAQSPITLQPGGTAGLDDVLMRSVYPVSRYLRAFDAAFSAAGYNSFHELIAFAVPTVFVPNEHAVVDDQAARARFAEWAGAALAVSEWSTAELLGRVEAVLEPHVQAHLSANCRRVFPGNGAADAAAVLAGLARQQPARVEERG
jgi:UDP:flavonoid glycosyltransferase YjiC (YdhE family)